MRIKKFVRLLNALYGRYKRYTVILLFLSVLGGLLETLGVSILIPLFSHVLQAPIAGAETLPSFLDWFLGFFDIELRLRFLLPLIVLVFFARAAVLFVLTWVRISLSSDYEKTIRIDLYRAFLSAPWRYFSQQKIGFAENTLMVDVAATTRLFMDLTNGILHGSGLAVYAVFALIINPFVATITLLGGGTLLFLFRPFLARTRRYAQENVRMNKTVAHDINESILGMKTVKALGAEGALISRAVSFFENLQTIKIRQTLTKSATSVAVQPVSILFVLGVFMVSFLSGEFNLAVFAITIFLIARIFVYVDRMQNIIHVIADAMPYGEHIVRVRDDLSRFRTGVNGKQPFAFSKELSFSGVSFAYDDERPVLSQVSFSIAKGHMHAIIGASGAGKTTVVDLMLRLLTPSQGSITLDSVPIQDINTSAWHERVGYVAQDPFLVNGTLEENIRFYDPKITDDDIVYAIRAASLSDVVLKLPEGIKSQVGERGLSLSGGERQRVALARVLARRPELLILDEPTSALDAASEDVIRQALIELKGAITTVIIAHKIETIRAADHVLVVKDAAVAVLGSSSELLEDSHSGFSDFFKSEKESL